jgi:hypothetical protein
MRISGGTKKASILAVALSTLISISPICLEAQARHHRHSSGSSTASARASHTSGRHHGRYHTRARSTPKAAAKPRYAYPVDIFMMDAPSQDLTLLAPDEALKARYAFQAGNAENYPPNYLVRAGAMNFYPLHGGIFGRREEVKYIVVHSTETGVPQDARHVINSWSSGGRRHPGAQFIVDRDGTIFEAVDPKYATVHVNIFKTLPGINNDNSIGIEMCHTGSQNYPSEQRAAVIRLLTYLQDRFHVLNENIITHRYAQQGDHTDPVAFDFEEFIARKDDFRNRALAMKRDQPATEEPVAALENEPPPAAVYLEVHRDMPVPPDSSAVQLPLPIARRPVVAPAPAVRAATASAPVNRTPSLAELQQQLNSAQNRVFGPGGQAPIRGEIEMPPGAVLGAGQQ